MHPAVDHVHHGCGQDVRVRTAEVSVQREAVPFGGGACHGERYTEHRVRAERRLVGAPVQILQHAIDVALIEGVEPGDLGRDRAVHVRDRAQHTFAAEPALVAVAELEGLMFAGGGAGRHRRASERAVVERHIDLDRRVPSRIQHFAGADALDRGHRGDDGTGRPAQAGDFGSGAFGRTNDHTCPIGSNPSFA